MAQAESNPGNNGSNGAPNEMAVAPVGELFDGDKASMSGPSEIPAHMDWYRFFMGIAVMAATRSKDPKTTVGCCLVMDNRVIGIGYNGFPEPMPDEPQRWGDDNKEDYVIHAEVNAVLFASKVEMNDMWCYVTLFPCQRCAQVLIQKKVKAIVYLEFRPEKGYEKSFTLLKEHGVLILPFQALVACQKRLKKRITLELIISESLSLRTVPDKNPSDDIMNLTKECWIDPLQIFAQMYDNNHSQHGARKLRKEGSFDYFPANASDSDGFELSAIKHSPDYSKTINRRRLFGHDVPPDGPAKKSRPSGDS